MPATPAITEPAGAVAPLPGDDNILGYNVMLAAALLSAQSNALLRDAARLNMRQYMALRQLRERPNLGSAELGRLLFITPPSSGTLLEGLERLGYIVREGGDLPGQKLAVRLTPAGERVVGQGDRLIARREDEHRERMAPGEAAVLNALLRKLLATLR